MGRSIAASSLSLVLVLGCTTYALQDAASTNKEAVLPPCSPDRAIDLVEGEVDKAADINDVSARIGIVIRVASTLWKFKQDKARAIFARAYDIAEKDFLEQNSDEGTDKQVERRSSRGDQRFTVIQAISKYDLAWSRQLAKAAAEETRREIERRNDNVGGDSKGAGISSAALFDISNKLLSLASSILEVDQQTAVGFAQRSLQYPATLSLPQFLFKLAAADQTAGDQLYQEALIEYNNSALRNLLLLSAYPFGSNRIVLGVQSITIVVPSTFVPNSRLQQLFLSTLFRRAELTLSNSTQLALSKSSEPTEIYIVLSTLEPQIAQYQPTLSEKASALRVAVASDLYPDARQQANSTISRQLGTDDESFPGYVERAERAVGSSQRDQYLALAVLKAPDDESLDRLSTLAKRVSDSKTREQLLNWLYFKRAQSAIKAGRLDDARQLANKVEQIDLRAYLSYEIAAEALKRFEDRSQAKEVLEDVTATARKLDNTNEKARTLLGISHLYAKLDPARALEIMRTAVKTINNIAAPDFSSTGIVQKIEGAQFGYNARYDVAGFSLENALRELAPFDFESTLWQAQSLEDKTLRSKAIIAVAASCLEKAQPQKENMTEPRQVRKK